MKLTTTYFDKIIGFTPILLLLIGLSSCGSSQYYAENPDGIYPTPKKKKTQQQVINDPYRTFSNDVADIEEDLYYEQFENPDGEYYQEPAILENNITNVYINNTVEPYWTAGYYDPFFYGTAYYGVNFFAPIYYPPYYSYHYHRYPNNIYYGKRIVIACCPIILPMYI
jgi:hypothetical protein